MIFKKDIMKNKKAFLEGFTKWLLAIVLFFIVCLMVWRIISNVLMPK